MCLQFTSCVYGNNLKPSEQMIAEDDEDDELFFVVWFIEERLLTLFPVGAIVRDPHHRESPTRRIENP